MVKHTSLCQERTALNNMDDFYRQNKVLKAKTVHEVVKNRLVCVEKELREVKEEMWRRLPSEAQEDFGIVRKR